MSQVEKRGESCRRLMQRGEFSGLCISSLGVVAGRTVEGRQRASCEEERIDAEIEL
jgi:hypothetical protein